MPAPELTEADRRWVAEQRKAQGLPEKVEDPEAIETVAAIFRNARRARSHARSETA